MKAGTRKPGGRPTQKQAAELDAQILDGARSVFCRSGVANASLDEIALTLGVSKHTIYRRYPNKAALLEAVVKRDLGRFREALEASASAAAGPLDALRRVALRYVEIGASRDYAAFYLSVSAEAALSGPLQAEHPATMGAILVDLLEGANNRVRLAGDGPTGKGQELLLFEQRWAVFLAAFGAKRGL
jgi:AcrR family transcriptional regulator